MEYIDEYRDKDRIAQLVDRIKKVSRKPIKLMEVCGTHTVTIVRNGIRQILPDHIRLISGPGCPVCVTPVEGIDRAIALAQNPEITITTFGDLLRVPGSNTSLLKERGRGADVRVVYSALDGLRFAEHNRERDVVFLGVGFETTAPTVAAVIQRAKAAGIDNFTVLSMHKVIPPALEILVQSPELDIDGFICPGHVSTIIGSIAYESVALDYHVPCVIAGFEPLDVLQAIALLVEQIEAGESRVEIQYRRGGSPQGNVKAKAALEEVFQTCDSTWRGFGSLPKSGLTLASTCGEYNAEARYDVPRTEAREPEGCLCGSILRGLCEPPDCSLFRKICRPENPVGACMVSSEGTCAAYYKYGA
jgi:hydrogenase expression/formation protein HypD